MNTARPTSRKFFKAAYDTEKALYSTFLLTSFREMEVVHLYWSNINFDLQMRA